MHDAVNVDYLRWIVLLPLLGATINGLLNRRLPKAAVDLVAVGSVGAAFALAVKAFLQLRALPADGRMLVDHVYSWIPIGQLNVDVSFMVDPLTAVMVLLVTGVGSLIHLYSTGYMKGDEGYQRYFAYLNLFVFSMLTLVLGDNLLLLFVGWEGVGLCSYLLIGFWFHDLANSAAGKKAFVVNRIGDFGFLLGMFVIYGALAGHVAPGENVLAFNTMAAHADLLAPVAVLAGLLLFVGATGKSAQIPLYVWLPDAMAGPTPVSALIHAATMVTAGVYMVARMSFLYDLAPAASATIAVIGAATALVAATIAIAQTDIKKVLAYSTVSQLGYMFLACGVGAYAIGIFHVLTHAFFKALLFLGAGSVIHAMHHEQDMRAMGGLRGRMPITFATMFVATLAIAGIAPFAGFFSKDEILYKAFLYHKGLWVVGFLVAGLTAFYMARLMGMTFLGKGPRDEHAGAHAHESPWTMTLPLVVLGVLSAVGGFMGVPEFLGGNNWLHHWLDPVFSGGAAHGSAVAHGAAEAAHGAADAGHGAGEHHDTTVEWILAIASVAMAGLAVLAGLKAYAGRAGAPPALQALTGNPFHRLLERKYLVDELYDRTIVWPLHWLSDRVLWRIVDAIAIDGILVNGSARTLAIGGQLLRLLQNGLVRWYAWSFAAGVLALFVFLARRAGLGG